MSKASDIEQAFPRGLLRPELFIGVLSSVSAQAVRFNVSDAGSPSGAHFLGGRYGKGEVGEFVLIEGQTNLLLGRIVEVHLPDKDRRSVDAARSKVENLDAVGTIQLLGSVAMDNLRVTAGVESYPRLGDRIYAAPHKFVADLPRLMEPEDGEDSNVLLELGTIDVALESSVYVRPEKLFGRHCAILGTTGGGKSWTTARLIEECLKHTSKLILLDATGEYCKFHGKHIINCHLGSPVTSVTAEGSTECSIPPTSFIEPDFIALFEPSGRVQGPKLKAAIESLRLAKIDLNLATEDGLIIKERKERLPILRALAKHAARIHDPSEPFDVKLLPRQIVNECVQDFGEPNWGGRNDQEIGWCAALIARINGVFKSPSLSTVFCREDQPSCTEEIADFINSDKRLFRLCLSGVGYEYRAREIIANVIGRYLLSKARTGSFLKSPTLVLVDEAHNFLGRHLGTEDFVTKLDAFEIIAKEGRKYGLNICLTTQRPRDITEGVLSQMGTLIVHRLTNDKDREVVERACGEIDRSASSFLPNLKPGEVAIIGADFPIPLTIQISPPTVRPQSDGPNYQKFWSPKHP